MLTITGSVERMRLSPEQIESIRQATHENFGADTAVWLFGSRVDDARRGGDVDLYVETTQSNTLMSALRCKIAIEDALDLHVDLVVKEPGKDKPIFRLAKEQGIRL
ncbi:MAG: nucleotidyltransferase domain-containing protein [Pseudomonadota bacterium]